MARRDEPTFGTSRRRFMRGAATSAGGSAALLGGLAGSGGQVAAGDLVVVIKPYGPSAAQLSAVRQSLTRRMATQRGPAGARWEVVSVLPYDERGDGEQGA